MECEQKNQIEKPFKFSIRRSVTLCMECERYDTMNKAFIHPHTSHVAVLKWRVIRVERPMKTEKKSTIDIEEGEKPVKKDAQDLLNSAGITSPSLASQCHILHICSHLQLALICAN